MRTYPPATPIPVRADDAGRPAALTLSGENHAVKRVENVHEPRLDWWSPAGEVHRRYFLVTTDHGLICEIYHDVAGGRWYLAQTFD